VASLADILLIDPDTPQVMHWWRDEAGGWQHRGHAALEAEVVLPKLAALLRLTDAYAGLEFRPRPRLVPDAG
jgi:hypothetical protein